MKNKKKFMIGAYSIGLTAIVVAVVIALNLLAAQLPATFAKLDASKEQILSIGADTKNVIKNSKVDITIYHIFSEGAEDTAVSGMLERYKDASKNIEIKKVDPLSDPTFTSKYTDANLSQNSLIVVSEKRNTVISGDELYMFEIEGYEGQYLTYAEYSNYAQQMAYYGQSVSAKQYFFAENEITRAIDYVSHDKLPIIYNLVGHGEVDISSGAYGQLIADENVELRELSLLSGEKIAVPGDASALIISALTNDISEAERDALISYLNKGGKIIYMSYFEYFTAEKMPNMNAVCAHMGLEAVEGLIVESDETGYTQYPYYLLPSATGKGITSGADASNLYLFMIASHGIKSTGTAKNVSVVPLLETTKGAYIYTEENAKNPEKAEKQTFTVAYESTITDEEGNAKGTLYWFATPEFLSDAFVGYGNGQLFTTLLTKTCDKPSAVSVIGKELSQSYLQLTASTSGIWGAVVIGIIPAAFLVCGFIVWVRRRSR